MEKVKVTKEQAEAIEAELKVTDKKRIVQHHIINLYRNEFPLSVKKIDTDSLIKALYIGYEVEPEFKVGDVVVFEYGNEVHVIGEIIEIETEDFIAAKVDDPKFPVPQLIAVSKLRHATESEIAQEKERRFWSGLGREVNEYKIGDVVSTGSVTRPIKAIWNEGELSLEGLGAGNPYKFDEVFLVCPVENRLDVNVDE